MMGWQWHQLNHMQIICTSLQTDNHASTSSLHIFYRPDALPASQPTVSKHSKIMCPQFTQFSVPVAVAWSSPENSAIYCVLRFCGRPHVFTLWPSISDTHRAYVQSISLAPGQSLAIIALLNWLVPWIANVMCPFPRSSFSRSRKRDASWWSFVAGVCNFGSIDCLYTVNWTIEGSEHYCNWSSLVA